MKTLKIDEKWSVEYDPENNGRPVRVLRYGEDTSHATSPQWDWTNDVHAMFYALLEDRTRIAELEQMRADGAAFAEREPVAWQRRCLFPDKHTGEKPQWQDCPAMEVKSWPQHDYQYRPLYAAPLPLTDLEAENARLKAELAAVKEMYAREGAKALYELERAEEAEARLAEALKALDAIIERSNNDPLGTSKVNDMRRISQDALAKAEGRA